MRGGGGGGGFEGGLLWSSVAGGIAGVAAAALLVWSGAWVLWARRAGRLTLRGCRGGGEAQAHHGSVAISRTYSH